MVKEFEKLWVVEYSRWQDCFHVDTLMRSLEKNVQNMLRGDENDYQTIGIFDNQKDAQKWSLKLRKEIGRRGPLEEYEYEK